jgi:hypothetical protein
MCKMYYMYTILLQNTLYVVNGHPFKIIKDRV